MKTRVFICIVLTLLLAVVFAASCTSAETEVRWQAMDAAGNLWGIAPDTTYTEFLGMSPDNEEMTITMLDEAGMDTDLDDYEEVFLLNVAAMDGSHFTRAVVVKRDDCRYTIIPLPQPANGLVLVEKPG